MAAPTGSTEWASSLTALTIEPTAVHKDKGWDTDDGTINGIPERPTLQADNGWQKNVHEWLQHVTTNIGQIALTPAGSIISVMPHLTGAAIAPPSGTVVNGWMTCDGSAIPPGNTLSGVTPILDNDRFIMGANTSGNTGGVNSKTLVEANLPSHNHSDGSYTTSITGGPYASSGHGNILNDKFTIKMAPNFSGGNWFAYSYKLGSTWTAERYYLKWSTNDEAYVANFNYSIRSTGWTDGNTSTTSLGGSNSVGGNSSYTGSGSSFDLRPIFMSAQFLIKVI